MDKQGGRWGRDEGCHWCCCVRARLHVDRDCLGSLSRDAEIPFGTVSKDRCRSVYVRVGLLRKRGWLKISENHIFLFSDAVLVLWGRRKFQEQMRFRRIRRVQKYHQLRALLGWCGSMRQLEGVADPMSNGTAGDWTPIIGAHKHRHNEANFSAELVV